MVILSKMMIVICSLWILNQIGITNAVFSPTEKEIDLANKIIEAYEKAKEEKSGVTTVDGVLVEELHVKQSLALISKMKMIQSMS